MSQDTDLIGVIESRLFDVDGLPDERHRVTENDGKHTDNRFAEPWMRVTHMFGGEAVRTLPTAGGRLEKLGITQVDLFTQPGKGREKLDELADAVRDAFPADKSLGVNGRTLKILYSKRSGGRMDGKWWADRIDISWRFNAANPA